jgi:hypothetical protein
MQAKAFSCFHTHWINLSIWSRLRSGLSICPLNELLKWGAIRADGRRGTSWGWCNGGHSQEWDDQRVPMKSGQERRCVRA